MILLANMARVDVIFYLFFVENLCYTNIRYVHHYDNLRLYENMLLDVYSIRLIVQLEVVGWKLFRNGSIVIQMLLGCKDYSI